MIYELSCDGDFKHTELWESSARKGVIDAHEPISSGSLCRRDVPPTDFCHKKHFGARGVQNTAPFSRPVPTLKCPDLRRRWDANLYISN